MFKVAPGASLSTGLKAKRYYTQRLTIKKALIGTEPFGGGGEEALFENTKNIVLKVVIRSTFD